MSAALLETWNPNNNDQNYLVVSVDTTYPYVDSYSEESAQYRSVRNAFIMGSGRSNCRIHRSVCGVSMAGVPVGTYRQSGQRDTPLSG